MHSIVAIKMMKIKENDNFDYVHVNKILKKVASNNFSVIST